jgi:predicted ATPase/DNA-binding SARP family transcriptional activator
MLQVWLLGSPRFRADARVANFAAPPRAVSLLAYLLVRGEQSRSALTGIFWRGLPEAEAAKKLRSHLWYIRASGLPDSVTQWLVADRRTVRWQPTEPVWVDVVEYESLAADPQAAERAVELYGGDFLAGIDDQWLRPVRSALRERQAGLLSLIAERARRSGDPAKAAEYARRALDIDPHREDALRALVGAVGDSGNRASAAEAYREFAQRLLTDLGVEPAAETTAVYRSVLGVGGEAAHNLPAAVTSFQGRERDVEMLQATLAERRLVSVVGTAGIGKTRLALEAARGVVRRYADGVWFVDLAPLAGGEAIWTSIAATLRLSDADDRSVTSALRHARALLILDNCEHVASAAAEVAGNIVSRCENVSLLATSREALRIDGERILHVAPLESPSLESATVPTASELERYPTVQLFLDRAADTLGAAPILDDEGSRRALVRILEWLDGIPLAIELVAAQMESFSFESLARELDGRFLLSATRSRTAPERQRTLQAALDWSYALLSESERRTLRSLGAFVGTWSMESAKQVLAAKGVDGQSIAASVALLVRKSMVTVADRSALARYRLLEPVRAYAIERLREAGEHDVVARRHAVHFAELARDGDDNPPRRQSLQADLDNFRAALRWTIADGRDAAVGSGLIGSLYWLFAVDALMVEGVRWCVAAAAALGRNPEPLQVVPVLLTMSGLHYLMHGAKGSAEASVAAATTAVERLRGVDDSKLQARALCTLACALDFVGRSSEAHAAASEALAFARACGATRRVAQALHVMADTADRSEVEYRRNLIGEALSAYRAAGHELGEGTALGSLSELEYGCGNLAEARRCALEARAKFGSLGRIPLLAIASYSLSLGDMEGARAAARESLASSAKVGALQHVSAAVQTLAAVALALGDPKQAARLLGASEAVLVASQCPRFYVQQQEYDATLTRLREALSPTELEARRSEGRTWSFSHVVGEAQSA